MNVGGAGYLDNRDRLSASRNLLRRPSNTSSLSFLVSHSQTTKTSQPARVSWEPLKLGRAVQSVRFAWALKAPAEAEQTAKENERHSKARRKVQKSADAPPLVVEEAKRWFLMELSATERQDMADRYGAGAFDRSEQTMVTAYEAESAKGTANVTQNRRAGG